MASQKTRWADTTHHTHGGDARASLVTFDQRAPCQDIPQNLFLTGGIKEILIAVPNILVREVCEQNQTL